MAAPFLITGMGLSGTRFLADLLNQSPTWTVNHESPGGVDDSKYLTGDFAAHAAEVSSRFFGRPDGDVLYGEVNSQLRNVAYQLNSTFGIRVFVLVRNPVAILQSLHAARGRDRSELIKTMDELEPGIDAVVALADKFPTVLRIEDAAEPGKLEGVASTLGIDDIPWDLIDRRPTNMHTLTHDLEPFFESWSADEIVAYNDRFAAAARLLGYAVWSTDKENAWVLGQTEVRPEEPKPKKKGWLRSLFD